MPLQKIETMVGLADSEIVDIKRDQQSLSIIIQAWNHSKIVATFKETLILVDMMASDLSSLCVYEEETDLVAQALRYHYDNVPSEHTYKHYVFLNEVDIPCLELVSSAYTLTIHPN